MKKTLKTMILAMILAVCLAFTGCGISQSTVDKINEAAKEGEPMTIEQVKKRLGDDYLEGTLALGSGVMIYVKGCDDWEDVQENLDEGKSMKAVIVTCVGGNAVGAVFKDEYKGEKK
jgi:hypothetical protein